MEESEALLVGRLDGVLDLIKGGFDGLELSPSQLRSDQLSVTIILDFFWRF
jgi:hypothetical protein